MCPQQGSAEGVPFLPGGFLDMPPEESTLERSRAAIVPVPYDSTTSYKAGAREGPRAIIQASRHLEDYDLELGCDPSRVGIHTTPELEPHVGDPALMVERVCKVVLSLADAERLVGLLGGEHTITIGAVRAFRRLYPDLSVLYLDAHADLRDEYMGTRWGHASVARRLCELCPVVQVGVRSLSREEHELILKAGLPVFFWGESSLASDVVERALTLLSPHVYVSVDLDVFDPAIMPAVGTPEPGGMNWDDVLAILRPVGGSRKIVGFDVTELSPGQGPEACAFAAAKLAYKLIGYATHS